VGRWYSLPPTENEPSTSCNIFPSTIQLKTQRLIYLIKIILATCFKHLALARCRSTFSHPINCASQLPRPNPLVTRSSSHPLVPTVAIQLGHRTNACVSGCMNIRNHIRMSLPSSIAISLDPSHNKLIETKCQRTSSSQYKPSLTILIKHRV